MLKEAIFEKNSQDGNVIVELVGSNGSLNIRVKNNKLVKKLIYRSYTRTGPKLKEFSESLKIPLSEGKSEVKIVDLIESAKVLPQVKRYERKERKNVKV
jgi:hypothetical protein